MKNCNRDNIGYSTFHFQVENTWYNRATPGNQLVFDIRY